MTISDVINSYLHGGITLGDIISSRLPLDADENCNIDVTINSVIDGYQYDSFIEDKSLSDYITFFTNETLVRAHLISDNDYNALCGSVVNRRDMMLAQSFMLSAAKNSAYSLYQHNGQTISSSAISIPCFFGNLGMIAIPFDLPVIDQRIFILCNEFWGHPCAVINFNARSYYSDSTSPKFRLRTYARCLNSVAASIAAWLLIIASKYTDNVGKTSVALLTGGSPNPSHAHWNYLGGLHLFNSLFGDNNPVHALQLSDLIFPNPYANIRLHDVSRLTPIERYHYLAATKDIVQPIWLRFSAGGLNPHVSVDIARKVRERVGSDVSLIVGASSLIHGGRPLAFSSPSLIQYRNLVTQHTIVLTVRGGRRKIYEQAQSYAALVEQLVSVLGRLTVFIDGSTNSLRNQTIKNLESSQYAMLSNEPAVQKLASSGKLVLVSLLNTSIEEQLCHYANCSTFLTYRSGGSAKFSAFLRQAGIVVGPISDVAQRGVFSLDAALEAGVNIPNNWTTLFHNELIYVPHDRVAYSHLLTPSIARNCQPVSSGVNNNKHIYAPDFQQDFSMDISSIAALILAVIHANSFMVYSEGPISLAKVS